jgi:uncharacterized membrane protein YeaQ/YmgE (transglycosylase-associated protein family)
MSGVGLFGAVVVGMMAGWIADLALGRRHGLFVNLIVGVFGSMIGALLVQGLAIRIAPGFASSLIVSTIGAVILLAVLGLLRRRRQRG